MKLHETGRPSLLIIDDNARLLRGLERMLGTHFHVSATCSASEAMAMLQLRNRRKTKRDELLEKQPGRREAGEDGEDADFDVVIVDNHMPGMMGTQLIALLQRARPDIVPILMTGESTHSLRHVVQHELKGVRLLEKPFRGSQVVEAVCVALGEHRDQAAAKPQDGMLTFDQL